jgi:hypothetical protein
MRSKKAKGERWFRVRWDTKRERYVAMDDHGDLLGVDCTLDSAIGDAVREAKLASHAGCRVTVLVENSDGIFKREYVAQPTPSTGANHPKV